jgi:hypothetical protein
MSVEIVGFNGVPAELVCGLHRAVWRDKEGLFELNELRDGSSNRCSVFEPDFERAIERGHATAVSGSVDRASPWVLVASRSFADSDGVRVRMTSVKSSERGFYWHADDKQSLRELAAAWSAALVVMLEQQWRGANPNVPPAFDLWLRHITRLRAAYSVTLNPTEAQRCALHMLALGQRIEEKLPAMRRAVARLGDGALAHDETIAERAAEFVAQYGVAAQRAQRTPSLLEGRV